MSGDCIAVAAGWFSRNQFPIFPIDQRPNLGGSVMVNRYLRYGENNENEWMTVFSAPAAK